ncbi:hypothetical protein [Staphylococcus intermedius]|nr:hypothetical protein [Staphylococcus intermedius]PCF83612.1 hypothetical protein B4W76_12675 [Staphylococcus intermedius]PCF85378.1 hypothetical protein B4W75_12425 [Staphylococcus intermedius]PNZ49701.1 hypothetical protein CD138_12660 [Staphylococcus intermedius NCTC 11048]
MLIFYNVVSILIGSTLIFRTSNETHAKNNSLVKEDTTPVRDKNFGNTDIKMKEMIQAKGLENIVIRS